MSTQQKTNTKQHENKNLRNMTLKEKIKDLEKQLEVAKRHTYVYDTIQIHCNDGELYIYYGEDKCVVFDVNDMFDDLPFIVSQVVKEQAKMQEWKLNHIKDSLKEIK